MLAYIVRRLLYAIPVLIGVNLITFALFFVVNSPDDMARMQLGGKDAGLIGATRRGGPATDKPTCTRLP